MHQRSSRSEEGRTKKLVFLAHALSQYPTQVRADLQRYFGLNLDRMGTDFSAFHAGACLSCLPLGSSLLSAVDERAAWNREDFLLHGIMQMLAGKEIPFPWDKAKSGIDGIETESMPIDQFKNWYEKTNWKGVNECRTL